jgi:glycerophosphoryl diester phosphodiesterase
MRPRSLLNSSVLVGLLALGASSVPSSRAADPVVLAPTTGFYSLETRKVYDTDFDPTSVPKLTYWYQEVDPTVEGVKFGVAPAATNRLGAFIKMKIEVRGNENTPPADRYVQVARWKLDGKKEGPIQLLDGAGGEKILRLFDKSLDHPLVDYALISLGLDQRAAAASLHIDPSKFSSTMYLAHRGVARIPLLNRRGVFPGNTMESMEHALWNGYPGFEIDIQMTKDKVLVVNHDQKLNTSTDCKGKISDRYLSEILDCSVNYTGVVPDVAFFHNRALIPGKISTLKQVLDRFLPDPRLQHIVLDVKPGDIDAQTTAFTEMLASYPKAQADKIIFLMRSTEMIHRLEKDEGQANPLYAWEGSTGWETLEKADKTNDPDQIFQDLNDREDSEVDIQQASPVPEAKSDIGLSLSLGLGLGMSGFSHDYKGSRLVAALQILKSLPKVVARLWKHHFGNGSVDIDVLSWSKRNKAALKRLTDAAAIRGQKIVGWTVNTKAKIGWLRANSPKIDFVLSDLPYRRLMQVQLDELTSAL